MVCGWGNSTSFPRAANSVSKNNQAKKKQLKQQSPDTDLANARVRCVHEDFDSPKEIWKANVEPGTYRYITNNGIYRTIKNNLSKNNPDPERRHSQRDGEFFLNHENHDHPYYASDPHAYTRSAPLTYFSKQGSSSVNNEPKYINPTTHVIHEDLSWKSPLWYTGERELTKFLHRVDSAPSLGARNPSQEPPNPAQKQDRNAFSTSRADTILRPLEKLTPQQKIAARRVGQDRKDNSNKTKPGNEAEAVSFMAALNAFNHLHNQTEKNASPELFSFIHNPVGRNVDSDIRTYVRNHLLLTHPREDSGAKKTATQSKETHGSKFSDSNPGKNSSGSHKQNSSKGSGSQKVEFKSQSIGYVLAPSDAGEEAVSGMALPEISGKRIAVMATSHRLL
ncbi:uncharacterized protein LOC131941775 [Physella acuta]|uniref:uncharacterized protein LOC131941775 n=1 Tax=Physella acuta TaxID=109671 RepID=UPI0027DAD683|nr:uncharacterized protein LOC131941775 [Physella acuta]XP_059157264.1 uncharacterized protein LOC131941775 [Physella acuta]